MSIVPTNNALPISVMANIMDVVERFNGIQCSYFRKSIPEYMYVQLKVIIEMSPKNGSLIVSNLHNMVKKNIITKTKSLEIHLK